MVGHRGSSAGSYLADPTSPLPSHCASIVATSTLRVNLKSRFIDTDHIVLRHCSVVLLWRAMNSVDVANSSKLNNRMYMYEEINIQKVLQSMPVDVLPY